MIISHISVRNVALYLKLIPEDLTDEENHELEGFLEAAKSYVYSYTVLTPEVADTKKELSVAVFLLCQDFYDNRSLYTPSSQSPSKVLETILSMHSVNYL